MVEVELRALFLVEQRALVRAHVRERPSWDSLSQLVDPDLPAWAQERPICRQVAEPLCR